LPPYEDLDRAAEHEAWTAAFQAELSIGDAATYVNFMGAPTYARLRELKRQYDPDNMFRSNGNIPPG
jgi:FAD/FMN-containing dehydrogenase